jgi:hypothetical protein
MVGVGAGEAVEAPGGGAQEEAQMPPLPAGGDDSRGDSGGIPGRGATSSVGVGIARVAGWGGGSLGG